MFVQSSIKNNQISARQIAFFAAFLLPVYKLLEVPSLLAGFSKSGLLFPAILHFLMQGGLLGAILFIASQSEKTLFERIEQTLGKWSKLVYIFYGFYFLFYAVLPLLDAEKFVYAAFFDTAPTLFSFAFFFILAAFACTKGIKTVGRISDLALFLFLAPFLILLLFSLSEARINNLLPFFQGEFGHTRYAFTYTSPHFSDVLMLFPLIGNLRYQKRDALKIGIGYLSGALCTLLFLAVFYGVYSSIAFRQHYAFLKIAQYFPALTLIGRVDLLFVYMLCIVFFFFLCTPLQYGVDFFSSAFATQKKMPFAAIVAFSAFVFVLYANPVYNGIYALFCERLFPIFWIFSLLPLACFFLPSEPKKAGFTKRENANKEKKV